MLAGKSFPQSDWSNRLDLPPSPRPLKPYG